MSDQKDNAQPSAAKCSSSESSSVERNSAEKSTEQILEEWSHKLTAALEVPELQVDVTAVLALAAAAAHQVVRPAAPVSTFVVGYAAGLAAAAGADRDAAIRLAMEAAIQLCRDQPAKAQP